MLDKAKLLLQKYYGYADFRGGQAKVIANILARQDTLTIMPTGAGKSICFQIPAMLLPGVTLVISPLISLMKDQVDDLTGIGLPAAYINSSLSQKETNARLLRVQQGDYKLIYVAPERLESEWFCRLLESVNISLVAVDEAHCVSSWGHDFRPSYRTIAAFIRSLPIRPIVGGFTATATETVRDDIVNLLELRNPEVFISGFDRENLSFAVFRGANKREFVRNYVASHASQSGIIYAATRKEVDHLCSFLQKMGVAAGKYHAGMNEDERTRNQEAFIYDDIQVMIATNAFGMGIDKSNVRYVVHYNMPKNMEAYYQEAGRAGRDGLPSECILLYSGQDVQLQKFLIEHASNARADRKTYDYQRLQEMVDYCHTSRCLRKYILEYFGEEGVTEACGNCSTCSDERESVDVTIDAQKVLSCVLRMKERYGVSLVAEVLKGSKNKRVLGLKFDGLSTYGLMKERTLDAIKDLINFLVAEGCLCLTEGEYQVVRLGPKAPAVLKSELRMVQKVLRQEVVERKEDTLFEQLRILRRELAQREGVPPYVVFADSVLREMSIHKPQDIAALRQVKGVGEVKAVRYGSKFLEVIEEYVQANNSCLNADENREAVEKTEKIPSHLLTWQMYTKGMSLEEIGEARKLKPTTIQEHLMRCGQEGYAVNWELFIPPGQETKIVEVIKTVGSEKLRPIKEALPEEIDYMAIKAVIMKNYGL